MKHTLKRQSFWFTTFIFTNCQHEFPGASRGKPFARAQTVGNESGDVDADEIGDVRQRRKETELHVREKGQSNTWKWNLKIRQTYFADVHLQNVFQEAR